MTQTTFENFGVNIKKKRAVKKTTPASETLGSMQSKDYWSNIVAQEEDIDYDALKRKKLAELHLCYGSATVYRVGDKVLGIGDLRYYEDPIWGKNLMVRDIFHNFFVMRKMLLASKNTILGKSYDVDLYEYKSSKKEVMKNLQGEANNGHSVYEITDDKIIDYPFVAEKSMVVEWVS